MKKKKCVSILITNYNKGNFLEKTINSCLTQNFTNKEILVFDDCSTDNSINLLKKFKKINIEKSRKNSNSLC